MMTIEIDPVVGPDLWRRRLVKPLLGCDLPAALENELTELCEITGPRL
jgi:hypothetical protein